MLWEACASYKAEEPLLEATSGRTLGKLDPLHVKAEKPLLSEKKTLSVSDAATMALEEYKKLVLFIAHLTNLLSVRWQRIQTRL